ncbi:MAG: hypothetical protein HDT26_12370 [Subdoligranulum sp.]|nr:hypothetical protein [Subdoligranulum sp.]
MENTNYRELLGMPKLTAALNIGGLRELNQKQRKAQKNIKWCANDQWGFVNSWYDEKSEEARAFLLNPRELFDTIYSESLENVYGEGMCCFNSAAKRYLKDIRFCGKEFLQKVALYYTAKLLEEAVPEVEGTEEDAARVGRELLELKAEIM